MAKSPKDKPEKKKPAAKKVKAPAKPKSADKPAKDAVKKPAKSEGKKPVVKSIKTTVKAKAPAAPPTRGEDAAARIDTPALSVKVPPRAPAFTGIDLDWRTHDIQLAGDVLPHLADEWLLTNGTGAFAMGTLPGVNTRRYHGLFIPATRPPVGRIVALNSVFEQLELRQDDSVQTLEFSACMFPGPPASPDTFAPRGHTMLRRFQKGLSVAWTYTWGHVQFVRELMLHWQQQAATLRYTIRGIGRSSQSATLKLSPMITLCDFHALLHKDQAGNFSIDSDDDGAVTVRREGGAANPTAGPLEMTLRCDPPAPFNRTRDWWYNIVYRGDTERGQEDREDYFVPGRFEIPLPVSEKDEHVVTVDVAIVAESLRDSEAPESRVAERRGYFDRAAHLAPMLTRLAASTSAATEYFPGLDLAAVKRTLVMAADDFVVGRTLRGRKLSTILAGYPWFADWGRDTFIALPGLLLETGRFDEAKNTLQVFAEAIRDGLVPNRFDDYDEQAAHYNTVDGSLWFVHAAMRYLAASNDHEAWDGWLSAAVISIMEAYIKGTQYDIRMAGDCLITAGGPSTQLTWMDAACGGVVFTPRHGKAVEINALWYAALTGLSAVLKDTQPQIANHYDKLASRVKRAFAKTFWSDERQCLIDHVWTDEQGAEQKSPSLRPNQIFAASLADSPIPQTQQKVVLDAVRNQLLTPRGLRTLPPGDPNYHGRYTGDMFHRDKAYHQGTVWGWLIGPYVEAVLRVGKFSPAARHEAAAALRPLLDELMHEGLGQLHEIYEADTPHRPVGCIAQAWTIAEVLRALRLIEGA